MEKLSRAEKDTDLSTVLENAKDKLSRYSDLIHFQTQLKHITPADK
jgi:hypothetical protein